MQGRGRFQEGHRGDLGGATYYSVSEVNLGRKGGTKGFKVVSAPIVPEREEKTKKILKGYFTRPEQNMSTKSKTVRGTEGGQQTAFFRGHGWHRSGLSPTRINSFIRKIPRII